MQAKAALHKQGGFRFSVFRRNTYQKSDLSVLLFSAASISIPARLHVPSIKASGNTVSSAVFGTAFLIKLLNIFARFIPPLAKGASSSVIVSPTGGFAGGVIGGCGGVTGVEEAGGVTVLLEDDVLSLLEDDALSLLLEDDVLSLLEDDALSLLLEEDVLSLLEDDALSLLLEDDVLSLLLEDDALSLLLEEDDVLSLLLEDDVLSLLLEDDMLSLLLEDDVLSLLLEEDVLSLLLEDEVLSLLLEEDVLSLLLEEGVLSLLSPLSPGPGSGSVPLYGHICPSLRVVIKLLQIWAPL